jgi:CRISPR-associated endonuclease/helicase Cas3
MPDRSEFEKLFHCLTQIERPFEWQWDLFQRFLCNDLPPRLSLPTGLGKTSVMHIWLLALAWEAVNRPKQRALPTRLVWVVDRRVVVDQATTEAENLARRLEDASPDDQIRRALKNISLSGDTDGVLAVSTLRGQRADNRAWSLDPSRPAIIVGTVDMVGSRLLFSGYGDSRRRRGLNAGLLGQDALIVNDEAHLTPAFARLLEGLRDLSSGQRTLRTMLLSATPRDAQGPAFPGNLDTDLTNALFAQRYRAVKRLHLHQHDEPKKEIEKLALEPDRRTLVFVRSPTDARRLAATIENRHKGIRVPLLTGMQRGWERDQLLNDPVVPRFLKKDTQPQGGDPCWLVATSAGEVGIDMSSDRLITDLDTADHLLQRFGRLNRFGEAEGAAHVVYSEKQVTGDKDNPIRLRMTLEYLKTLNDVSPESLWKHPPPAAALSAVSHTAPLLPWHIDVWSMTSINANEWPGRPAVSFWLRGDEEDSPPETFVAWRRDIKDLADPRNDVPVNDLEDVFDCYPVLAHERLKQYTETLCEALKKSTYLDKPAILVAADGDVLVDSIGSLLDESDRFRYATLVLPPGVGYLDRNGMVDWSRPTDRLSTEDLVRYDVADLEGTRQRFRVNPSDEPPNPDLRLRCTIEIPSEEETGEGTRWIYFVGPVKKHVPVADLLLVDHWRHVASLAADLVLRLGLGDRLAHVFGWAAEWHDSGKDRPCWQRAAGNWNGRPALAKSSRFSGRMLGGYRHELGSVLDAQKQLRDDFSSEERDLALHLIATHHGWARPHFPAHSYDKAAYRSSERAALECTRRFGRLHRRHGAWGLAYLEAIFRCADAMASAGSSELPPNA